MSVDGNLYFLGRYMEEQDLAYDEFDGEQSDREEFSGEELYDLVDSSGYKETAELFLEKALEYPNAGFEDASKNAIRRVRNKDLLESVRYVVQVGESYYKTIKHWLDTKWLALDGDEESIIERVQEFLADIIYNTNVVMPEDFVESIVTGNELLNSLYELNEKDTKVAEQYLRRSRLGALRKGLEQSGLSKEVVFNSNPVEVSNKLLTNTKMEGRNRPRLQVDNDLFVSGLKTLGIPETAGGGIGNEGEAGQLYANVTQAFRQPTNSKAFQEVIGRVSKELNNRLEKGEDVRFLSKFYKDAGLFIISTKKAFLIVDTNVTLFQRLDPKKQGIVFRKSVHDVRVKDIKGVVSKL